MLLRTELESECSVSESESWAEESFTGAPGAASSFSDREGGREERELGREDLRDLLEDWDGERDWTRLVLLPLRSICSTLEQEKISLALSAPMLRLLASRDIRVLGSAARADSKLPFQENLSSSRP